MQNIWKEKLLLIRLLNKEDSMDIVWNGQERLRISMPSMFRSMVQEITAYCKDEQTFMEIRSDKTEKYQIEPGACICPDGQSDLRVEISVLPTLRTARYSLAGVREIQIGRSQQSDTKTLQEAHDKQLAALQRENPSADICAEILKNRTRSCGVGIQRTKISMRFGLEQVMLLRLCVRSLQQIPSVGMKTRSRRARRSLRIKVSC